MRVSIDDIVSGCTEAKQILVDLSEGPEPVLVNLSLEHPKDEPVTNDTLRVIIQGLIGHMRSKGYIRT